MSTPSYDAEKYTAPAGPKRAVAKTFDLWSSTTIPNISISGGGCAYCSIYNDISLYNPDGWGVSIGECVSIMAVENVSINDGRPYNALEMIAQLRAFSINSCGEIEKIGPQEEKYWDLDCPPCSLGYDEIYNDSHELEISDPRCVSYDQMVGVSLGMDYDCPPSLKILYKTRAIELNACGEIDSISPVTLHEKSVDLEDKSYFTGSVDVVVDTKQELDNDGGVTSSLNCSTDQHVDEYNGGSHSHDFTLDVITTTFTLTTFIKTRTLTYECGRLELVSAESGWLSRGNDVWNTQTIGCSGGGGGNPPPPQDVCDCDPGVEELWLVLEWVDGMGFTQSVSFHMQWNGYPDCTFTSTDPNENITMVFDNDMQVMSWTLQGLTPSDSDGVWDDNIVCQLNGGVFLDLSDPNMTTQVWISINDPGI